MDSLIGSMQDNVALGSIISLFKNSAGWRSRSLTFLNVVLILIAKHYLSKTEELLTPLRSAIGSMLRTLLYRKISIAIAGPGEESYYISRRINNNGNDSNKYYVAGLPVYYQYSSDESALQVELMRGFHEFHYRELVKEARGELERYQKGKQMGTVCRKFENNYLATMYQPNRLFPSENYKNLERTLSNYLKVSALTKSFTPLGVLIDGEQGLGKTKSADYLALQGLFEDIVRIDMTLFLDNAFDEIFKKCYHDQPVLGPTLFVIDEMDKYLDYFINKSYQKLIDGMSKSQAKTDGKKTKTTSDIPIPEKSAYVFQKKVDFLYALLRMLERDGLIHPCIIVFCSNNFETIFEGIDSIHFVSLKSRFMRFTFHRCNRNELISYLKYYNQLFINTEFYLSEERFEELCRGLKTEIGLPYRSLHHISILAEYNLEKIVNMVNTWTPEQSPRPQSSTTVSSSLGVPTEPKTLENEEHQTTESEGEPEDASEGDSREESGEESDDVSEDISGGETAKVSEEIPKIRRTVGAKKHAKFNDALPQPMKRIYSLLNLIDQKPSMARKLEIVAEIFQALADPEMMNIIGRSKKFRATVASKVKELVNQHPMVLPMIKESAQVLSSRFPEITIS